jgi:hypothetical protein
MTVSGLKEFCTSTNMENRAACRFFIYGVVQGKDTRWKEPERRRNADGTGCSMSLRLATCYNIRRTA